MIAKPILLWCALACLASPVAAAAPQAAQVAPRDVPPLSRYARMDYTQESGAPQSVSRLLQDADGYIWLTTTNALHRFDGVRFERIDPTSPLSAAVEGVRSASADPREGLWLGHTRGGVVRIIGDRVIEYGPESGLPEGKQILDVAGIGNGEAYAATPVGLFRLRGQRWEAVTPAPELHGQAVDSLLVDGKGRLWVKTQQAIFFQEGVDGPFQRKPFEAQPSLVAGLIQGPGDAIWSWSLHGESNLCRVHPDPVPVCWKADSVVDPAFDRWGSLWWAASERTFRIAEVASLDPRDPQALMRAAESLPIDGDHASITQDDSIWVLGDTRLTRLRRPLIEQLATPSGGLAPAPGGDVWVVSYARGLMRIGNAAQARGPFFQEDHDTLWDAAARGQGGPETFRPAERPVAANDAVVLRRYLHDSTMRVDRDSNGDIYAAALSPPALLRLHGDTLETLPLPPLDRGAVIRGTKRDAQGRLWLGLSRTTQPVYRREGDTWVAPKDLPIPPGLTINGFAFDRDGTLWLAAARRGVVAVTPRGAREFGAAQGADIGLAGEVHVIGEQVWALGLQGIAARKGDGFVSVRGRGGERFGGVTGLVQEPNGDLWFNGVEGLDRIQAAEWRRALAEPGYEVRYTRLDRWDGINSPAANGPFPSAARSDDGTLWFAMRNGLYRLDPRSIAPPRAPPPVLVGSVSVDGKTLPSIRDIDIPAGLHRVVIGFAAPSAERPERTRFRYQLTREGHPGEWIYIGGDRQVVFDQLGYGRYRLAILSSGRDGEWSKQPAHLEFRIRPAFHQTFGFYALLALAALAVLVLLYLLRVRSLSMRIRDEMDARLRERERIARDLHDTLLQGMQGLLLSFQGIASRMAPQDPQRARMEQVLDRTQDIVREGRDRVSELRDPRASTLDLPDSLQRHARDLAVENRLLCDVAVPEPPRALQPAVYEELLQIGREAIQNAMQHSHGTQVRVSLAYTDAGVLLKVEDDGVGLPPEAGHETGHWGVKGMQERAQLIGALLGLKRRPEGGTEVKVFVPAERAYPASR